MLLDGLLASAMNFVFVGAAFLLVLMVVVFVHEMGHFLVARWCGVTVTTFSMGFGKELWARDDRHGTRWRIAAIPLGGYVKFLDDANAASAPSEDKLRELTAEERAGAFQTKPVWQRAAVVFAGPLANFILAAAIYFVINATIGVRSVPPVIEVVEPGKPAAAAGIKPGDRIVAIDGVAIESFEEISRISEMSPGVSFVFDVERDGKRLTIPVTPVLREYRDDIGVTLKLGDLGIRPAHPARVGELMAGMPAVSAGMRTGDTIVEIDGKPVQSFEDIVQIIGESANRKLQIVVEREGRRVPFEITPVVVKEKDASGAEVERGRIGVKPMPRQPHSVSVFSAARLALQETWGNLVQTVAGIRDIVTSKQSADQVGGPILMAEVTARVVELGLEPMLRWTALISANIGLLNLLPIPVLDGGHLMFYAIEAIRRRPLSPRIQEIGFQIGMALVMMLVLFVNFNDLMRIGKRWLFGGG